MTTPGAQICHSTGKYTLRYFELERHAEQPEFDMVYSRQHQFSYPTAQYPNALLAKSAALKAASALDPFLTRDFVWQPSVKTFLTSYPVVQANAHMYAPPVLRHANWEGRIASILQKFSKDIRSQPDQQQVSAAAWLLGFWLAAGSPSSDALHFFAPSQTQNALPAIRAASNALDTTSVIKRSKTTVI